MFGQSMSGLTTFISNNKSKLNLSPLKQKASSDDVLMYQFEGWKLDMVLTRWLPSDLKGRFSSGLEGASAIK